jgi:LmbE family N-acetylglucosaminyl deacetylase
VSAELQIDAHSRVMFLAPHPDDDTLGASGLLRRTVARGGAVRILYATCGENNPWTQRLVERRFRIGAVERTRFGARRRSEALAALARLGVDALHAEFLEFPDQGMTDLLKAGGEEPVVHLARSIAAWQPGILVVPSLGDLHPDHSALSILAALALDRIEPGGRPATVLDYVIHSKGGVRAPSVEVRLSLTTEEQESKRAAIRCHATQLAVHRAKFMSFAGPDETFVRHRMDGRHDLVKGPAAPPAGAGGDAHLHLEILPRSRPGSFGRPRLALLGVAADGRRVACTIAIPRRPGRIEVRRSADGALLGAGTVARNGRTLVLSVPWSALPPARRLFTKIERPFGFFDEAGWAEIGVEPRPSESSPRREIRAGDRLAVACVVPCYNVAASCAAVVRGAAGFSNQVLVIDDGSTDETRLRLAEIESVSAGRVSLQSFASNRGKGVALIEGIRTALLDPHVAVIVTLDGDGQHRPEDVPRLLAAWREGADLVIGARGFSGNTPARSRIGNTLIRGFLRLFYPGCPPDTQSGFRALDRSFAEQVVRRVSGARYETETHMLLLAMDEGHPIATVPIPTIYSEGNRTSHFRPLRDSARIGLSALRWKMSAPESRLASEGEPSATSRST